jgi:hypothetical protein
MTDITDPKSRSRFEPTAVRDKLLVNTDVILINSFITEAKSVLVVCKTDIEYDVDVITK